MRCVNRLEEAERLDGWPDFIPRDHSRGIKALGRRYEVAVSRQLGVMAQRGVWWKYLDANGPGFCQTDFLILGDIWAVILECKHTWTEEGMEQLGGLYMPVIGKALDKKVLGIQVCKHLVPHHTGPVHDNLEAAVMAARTGHEIWFNGYKPTRLVTLHWRGIGPMLKTNTREFAHG
jgi:hypothetical protein